MKRSRLRDKFLKVKNQALQINYCRKFLKSVKNQHFNNLLLFSQIKPQEVKKLFPRKVMELLQIILNYAKCLANNEASLKMLKMSRYITEEENINKFP